MPLACRTPQGVRGLKYVAVQGRRGRPKNHGDQTQGGWRSLCRHGIGRRIFGGCVAMGILRAMAIRRRVKEMQEYARVLSVATAELRYRRDILAQIFVRVAKKCRQPYAAWLSELSQALMEAQQRQAYSYTEVAADFDQIWIEHADKLYESSGLKQEDMEYIYNLGQTIGYLDVQAQEEGLALLQADLGRHIRELEAEAKDRMRLSLVVGSVAGVLLIIILI